MTYKNPHCELTQDELKQRLRYEPETGQFLWLSSRYKCKIGTPAGYVNPLGYRCIAINRTLYLAHRLAWLYVHGRWPSLFIDHIDGNPSNNAIANLREADHAQNQHNTTSHKGWSQVEYGYQSHIKVRGETIVLGFFKTPEGARAAYVAAKFKYHKEFCPKELTA